MNVRLLTPGRDPRVGNSRAPDQVLENVITRSPLPEHTNRAFGIMELVSGVPVQVNSPLL